MMSLSVSHSTTMEDVKGTTALSGTYNTAKHAESILIRRKIAVAVRAKKTDNGGWHIVSIHQTIVKKLVVPVVVLLHCE